MAAGLQNTGRIITNAALLLAIVIGAFTTSGISFVKLIGVGLLVAVVADATLGRALLVPANATPRPCQLVAAEPAAAPVQPGRPPRVRLRPTGP